MKLRIVSSAFIAMLVGRAILQGIASHDFLYAQEEPPRAMWVWDVKIPTSPETTLGLIDFCKSKKIELLYLSAFNFNEKWTSSYKFFNALAHKNGIEVHALAGDPRWCIEKYHKQPIEWVRKVLIFNKQCRPEERFDGIHSDAEPYVLGSVWEQNRQILLRWYLDLNQKIADMLDIEGAEVVFGADIPFWYDDDASMQVEWHGTVKPPSFHMLDTVNEITIMDYRNFADGPNGSIALARFEIDYAGRMGKKVYIGQETKTDVYPEYISFGGLSEETMEKEIRRLIDAYIGHPGFAGIAIHHYRSYRKLVEKGK